MMTTKIENKRCDKKSISDNGPESTRNVESQIKRFDNFENYTNDDVEKLKLRFHQIAPKLFQPESLTVNHKISWPPGDKIVTGLTDLFSRKRADTKDSDETFETADDGSNEPNIMVKLFNFFTDRNTILVLFISALVFYASVKSNSSRKFLIIVTCIVTFSILSNTIFTDKLNPKLQDLIDLFIEVQTEQNNSDGECEHRNGIPVFETQGANFGTETVSRLLLSSMSILTGYTAKKSLLEGILSATKISDTQATNVTSVLLVVVGAIKNFLVHMEADELAKYFEIDAISDSQVAGLQKKVIEFVASFNSGNPETMLYSTEVYKTLYLEAKNLSSAVAKNSFDHRVVMDCLQKLTTVYQRIEELKLTLNGERIEPVGIMLRGPPGTKKGVLTKRIAKVLASKTIPHEWRTSFDLDDKDFFYNVPIDQFWDGYTNKAWITFFDDIFQRRDAVADNDSHALKIISMINSAPMTLKMANISNKNNVFFRSAFVIANSNLPNYNLIQSVANTDAVKRRFHFDVQISVNPKYDKLVQELGLPDELDEYTNSKTSKVIPNDFWVLNVVEHVSDKEFNHGQMDIVKLISLCENRHLTHRMNFLTNRKSEEDLIRELCKQDDIMYMEDINQMPGAFKPQSGISDYCDQKKKLTRSKHQWIQLIQAVNETQRHELDFNWYKLCSRKCRIDLFHGNFLDSMKKLHLSDNYYDCLLTSGYGLWPITVLKGVDYTINIGIDPLTGHKLSYLDSFKIAYNKGNIDPVIRILDDFCNLLAGHWMIILGLILFGPATLTYLYKFVTSFFESTVYNNQGVDYHSAGQHRSKMRQKIKLSAIKPQQSIVEPQSNVQPEFDLSLLPKFKTLDFGNRNNKNDVISKVFNKSLYIIYVVEHNQTNIDCEVSRLGHCLNVKGQIFLMPFHFVFVCKSLTEKSGYLGATVVITTTTARSRLSVSMEEFLSSFYTTESAGDSDICLFKLRSAQAMSVGCISSFLKEADFNHLFRTTSFKGLVIGSHRPKDELVQLRSVYTQVSFNRGFTDIAADWIDNRTSYQLRDTLMYNFDGAKGDCGSIVIPYDCNYENRVISGIHVAGGSGYGFGVYLSQEMLNSLIDELFPENFAFTDEEIPDYLTPVETYENQSSLTPIFTVSSDMVPMEVYKSEIRKSLLFGRLPSPYNIVKSLPAKIRPFYSEDGELIDPLLKAFNKYGKVPPEISYDLVSKAIESYQLLFVSNCSSKIEERKVIDIKTALHSFDNVNSISSSTSAGYPMSMSKTNNLKKLYYKAVENNETDKIQEYYERIASLVDGIIENYQKGIRPFFCYKQCGKDETREWFKVLEGKTRLFSACPFLMLILFRMYFGSFISDYVECSHRVGSAVGVNPYSYDWDSIARKLLQFSRDRDDLAIAAGDQGQFDTRQWTIIHNAILNMINDYYGRNNPDNKIRSYLFMEITNSRHIFRGKIYEWHSGLPSGNPMTAIINTIYNNIVFRISWQLANLDIKNFNKSCYLIVLGDDNVFSVESKYRGIFNEMTLPIYMDIIGMEYTTELKDEAVTPFRRLSEVEFLKRGFKFDDKNNRFIAPLRESAIAEMLNWTKKGQEADQITLDNMCFALREFSLHGKETFEHWKDNLLALKQEKFQFQEPHGSFPLNYDNTYEEVLKLEYYF